MYLKRVILKRCYQKNKLSEIKFLSLMTQKQQEVTD